MKYRKRSLVKNPLTAESLPRSRRRAAQAGTQVRMDAPRGGRCEEGHAALRTPRNMSVPIADLAFCEATWNGKNERYIDEKMNGFHLDIQIAPLPKRTRICSRIPISQVRKFKFAHAENKMGSQAFFEDLPATLVDFSIVQRQKMKSNGTKFFFENALYRTVAQ